MREVWAQIAGHPRYFISNLGRVRSEARAAPIIMVSTDNGKGYLTVMLGDRRRYKVHKLVAAAFLGPCPPNHEVNHKDTRKFNNAATNLEYTTHAGNMEHAAAAGVVFDASLFGENHPRSSMSNATAAEVVRRLSEGEGVSELARSMGLSRYVVSNIKHGRSWARAVKEGGVA